MIDVWCRLIAWFIPARRNPPPQMVSASPAVSNVAERVIAGARTVREVLGSGLPEIIYENALAHELRKAGLTVNQQPIVAVYYDGSIVGDYSVDLVVENTVLVELTVNPLNCFDIATSRKYLKASGFTLCLLLNFGTPNFGAKHVLLGA